MQAQICNECYAHLSGPFITALQIMEGVWQSKNHNIICYTEVIIIAMKVLAMIQYLFA